MNISPTPFEPHKLARNDDPSTSKAAAHQAGELRGRHHTQILAALNYDTGMTPYQIAAIAQLDPAAVFRRINELEKASLIACNGEAVGPTGRHCRT